MDVIIGCTYSVIAESCEWCVVDDKGITRCVPTICMFFLNAKTADTQYHLKIQSFGKPT